MKPMVWYERWNSFYERAIAHALNEIKGDVAVTDFLQAVGDRFEPLWARNKLDKHTLDVSRGLPTRSELIAEIKRQNPNIKASEVSRQLERDKKATRAELLEVADEFQAIARNNPFEKKGVVFAAWNAQSTDTSEG
ncbi:hypothetical protein H9Q72_014548, partial [Fusarium xylarioides]